MSTKHIYLLRHAQAASPDFGQSDKDRVLTAKGHADAKAVGAWMKEKEYVPDLVLCSPATRTRQTLDGVLLSLPDLKTEHLVNFYNAPPGNLFGGIQNAADDIQSVMVVAHNPSIYELAFRFSINQPITNFRPGTLAVIEYSAEKWSDLNFETTRLIDLREP